MLLELSSADERKKRDVRHTINHEGQANLLIAGEIREWCFIEEASEWLLPEVLTPRPQKR